MIFSAKKWNNGKELKAVKKENTAISFDVIEAPGQAALGRQT